MKKFLLPIAAICFFFSTQSCVVAGEKHDNGKHKGWYKNKNNPHHPASTNPGQSNGKSKNK